MNGTLKAVLGLGASWALGGAVWLMALFAAVASAGKGNPTNQMAFAAATSLFVTLAVIVGAQVMVWKWATSTGAKVALMVGLVVLQLATMGVEVMSLFVVFNR